MSDPEAQGTPEPLVDEEREVRIRRAPRLLPFLLTGAAIGVLVAGIVAAITPASADVSKLQAFGYLTIIFVVGFGAVAGIIVVILDAVLARRGRNAVALVEEVDEVDHSEATEQVEESTTDAETASADSSPDVPTHDSAETPLHGASETPDGTPSDLK